METSFTCLEPNQKLFQKVKTMQKDDNQQTKAVRKALTTTPLTEQERADISRFQDMQEHPEAYPENELEAMMDALDQQPDLEKAWREFESRLTADHPKSHFATFHQKIRKIAAILIGILILSGIAYATIHLVRNRQPMVHPEQAEDLKDSPRHNPQKTQLPWRIDENTIQTDENDLGDRKGNCANPPVRFNDISLDSILSVVSAHYGKTVAFRNETSKSMRFIITWNPDEPLTEFTDELNMFDGMIVTVHQDTICVETSDGKEDAL